MGLGDMDERGAMEIAAACSLISSPRPMSNCWNQCHRRMASVEVIRKRQSGFRGMILQSEAPVISWPRPTRTLRWAWISHFFVRWWILSSLVSKLIGNREVIYEVVIILEQQALPQILPNTWVCQQCEFSFTQFLAFNRQTYSNLMMWRTNYRFCYKIPAEVKLALKITRDVK